jgi:trehalose 6-phosphate synthase
VTFLVGSGGRPDHERALAGLRIADGVLVNPVMDGLNVVAKEAGVVSDRKPVLILSRRAGAYEQLREGAIGIHPLDVVETATAIERAFEMLPSEREARAKLLERTIAAATPQEWILGQLQALQ